MKLEEISALRIVFMGTPDFAVATLDGLLKNGYLIVGVITAPDRPAGRGRKLQESAVKTYALEKGVTVLQPTNLKHPSFIESLQGLKANLQIVVAFRMLPKVVWSMPAYGTFNLHASLLPDYRGAAPINWAIINGETETGVTTFFIDDKIDTGEIIFQQKTPIDANEDAGHLHDRLMALGADLVLKTVEGIKNGKIVTKKQKDATIEKLAPKIEKETCKINWNDSIDSIYNHIRGLSPYPAAWTTLWNDNEEVFLKIYETEKEYAAHNLKQGSILLGKKELKVAVANGYINLLEIQFPGKRKMRTSELINGLNLSKKAYMS
ncbi:MAG: methionyl-tRNA formyltransferase [Flavobacteriaceae bacterium]